MKISCDLNYRNKLWSKEKAGQVMGELCKYVDVCIANEEDAADVFGIRAANTDVTAGEVNREGYKDVAKQLADRFGFAKVAITLRESISANDNRWSAMLYEYRYIANLHTMVLLQYSTQKAPDCFKRHAPAIRGFSYIRNSSAHAHSQRHLQPFSHLLHHLAYHFPDHILL